MTDVSKYPSGDLNEVIRRRGEKEPIRVVLNSSFLYVAVLRSQCGMGSGVVYSHEGAREVGTETQILRCD